MIDFAALGHTLSVWLLPVLLAITLHEAAHGWAADKLGDDTARRLGRVTVNPLAHVDPFGTVLVPGALVLLGSPFVFGWAKPVPVAFHRLRRPKRDMVLVAAAGPAVNLVQAVVAAWAMHLTDLLPPRLGEWVHANCNNAVFANIFLAAFNLLPLPPLDGGRILTGLLPLPFARVFARLERVGLVVLLLLAVIVPLLARELGFAFNPLLAVLMPLAELLFRLVLALGLWWDGP
ncbi:MAG: site-2 protease family protein [Geminicoccaceae bacterium]|nr:site-2 protease family protein [Geminicoccaceae bacterium]MCS7268392.1 site-2 protease family protein [Geminicoccaceae bacterium]MCX7629454.1 site-2 protease family protein [Geminicoccaceae bacterium]MDW8124285.1 site-2 protease family protein [Geminicoccaceae bacterium]MDW8342202.1 site-2 protease family protein [Geminicoccaceae bacterium]